MPRLTKSAFAEKEGISVAVLDTWIYRHGLPVYQIGRRVYIDETDYEIWFASHRKVVNEKPIRQQEIAIPLKLRKSSIANKMRKIY